MVFVRDYVQLTFDGPVLSCYVWPTINTSGGGLRFQDAGYRDALCGFIGQPVVSTKEAVGSGLLLRFEAGSLSIHPASDELEGPEIAMLSGFSDMWAIWRPGEDTFADLD